MANRGCPRVFKKYLEDGHEGRQHGFGRVVELVEQQPEGRAERRFRPRRALALGHAGLKVVRVRAARGVQGRVVHVGPVALPAPAHAAAAAAAAALEAAAGPAVAAQRHGRYRGGFGARVNPRPALEEHGGKEGLEVAVHEVRAAVAGGEEAANERDAAVGHRQVRQQRFGLLEAQGPAKSRQVVREQHVVFTHLKESR